MELTDEVINQAIKSCYWRKQVHGVPICVGVASPCILAIEHGHCNTLKALFKNVSMDKDVDEKGNGND